MQAQIYTQHTRQHSSIYTHLGLLLLLFIISHRIQPSFCLAITMHQHINNKSSPCRRLRALCSAIRIIKPLTRRKKINRSRMHFNIDFRALKKRVKECDCSDKWHFSNYSLRVIPSALKTKIKIPYTPRDVYSFYSGRLKKCNWENELEECSRQPLGTHPLSPFATPFVHNVLK